MVKLSGQQKQVTLDKANLHIYVVDILPVEFFLTDGCVAKSQATISHNIYFKGFSSLNSS